MESGNISSHPGEILLDIVYHVVSDLLITYQFTFSLLHRSDKRFKRWFHMNHLLCYGVLLHCIFVLSVKLDGFINTMW